MTGPPPDSQSFIEVSDGITHYSLTRPENTLESQPPVVVFLHGATVSMLEFDRLLPFFTAANYTCLQFDFFGCGYSDRPASQHNLNLFTRQLSELLSGLAISGRVHLVGHSLGAAVAAHFARRYPAQVAKIILGAPLVDGFANIKSLYLLRIPIVGELLMKWVVVPKLIKRRAKRYRQAGMYEDQLKKEGFERSLLSLIRSGSLAGQIKLYQSDELRTIAKAKEVLIIRGRDDKIMSFDQFREVCLSLPKAFSLQPEGKHAVMLTRPELVSDSFLSFLSSQHIPPKHRSTS